MTLRADRRGSIGVMGALVAVPLIALAGVAVDATRLWLVQSRLQSSLDAAVLVTTRAMTESNGPTDGISLFWSNFGRTSKSTNIGYLGAVATAPQVVFPDANTVQMTTQAVVPTLFMGLLGVSQVVVHATSAGNRTVFGMELALVLDVTGPMAASNNIGALRQSASNLIDILYGSSDTQPNLWVSVVPYVASVNIDPSKSGWLVPGSLDQTQYQNTQWMGCVEARSANGNDMNDATPAQAPFTPFLWKSTRGKYFNGTRPVTGDNDWSPTHITESQQSRIGNNTVGPNLSCPQAPILALTASKRIILNTIAGLQATYRGGGFANLGLQAGWFTLSPNWRGLWGNPTLPLDYGTPAMQKVVVLMTGGVNQWFDWPGGAPGLAPSSYVGQSVDADYTAYGRLSENRLNITIPNSGNLAADSMVANANAEAGINQRMAQLCTRIKNAGITVYAITFGVADAATQALWKGCASKPDNYFNSPTQAALKDAFSQIGSQLASLRLTQ